MKKLFIFFLAFGYLSYSANAQQLHQLSQYALNDFVFNPAVVGKSHDLITKLSYRKQWAGGFDGQAPSTFALSGHTNFAKANTSKSVGLGMMIYSDVTGPTRRGGVTAAYAYHLPLGDAESYTEDAKHLSFGVGMSLLRQSVNYDELTAATPNDVVLGTGTESRMSLDANFGVYYYEENWFAGASVAQLLGNGVKLTDYAREENERTIQFDRHFFLSGGYRYDINEKYSIEPMLLMKSVQGAPVQFDITARAMYQKKYWVGATYRTQDAMVLMAGFQLNNNFNLAYSYDITTSQVRNVSSGSHEITIGYDFRWKKDEFYNKFEY